MPAPPVKRPGPKVIQPIRRIPDERYPMVPQGSVVKRVIASPDGQTYNVAFEQYVRQGDQVTPFMQHAKLTPSEYQALQQSVLGGIPDELSSPDAALPPPADLKEAFARGYSFQQYKPGQSGKLPNPNSRSRYAASALADWLTGRSPGATFYEGMTPSQRVAVEAGRLAGDVTGFGTQSKAWNIYPLDVVSTQAYNKALDSGLSQPEARMTAWAAASLLGYASGNWNPLNLAEGGRQKGFEAISADDADKRRSTNPVLDMAFHRGLLGRTGRLLPWEEFQQERPDVSREEYDAYREYLFDPGLLNLLKGTWTGVDGPEVRAMGYRITPLGALATAGLIGGAMAIGKSRMAGKVLPQSQPQPRIAGPPARPSPSPLP